MAADRRIVALVLALAAHLYGLYTPGEPGASEWFPNSDKLLHFFGFAVPTLLAMLVVRRGGRPWCSQPTR